MCAALSFSVLILMTSLVMMSVFAEHPARTSKNSPFGTKNVRARYPALALMRDTLLLPKPTVKPQKSTRHVSMAPGGGRERNRNPIMELNSGKLRRRKPVSVRYRSIFGPSKPIKGHEFVPRNIASFTGKLAQSRRQTFKWRPSGDIMDYHLFGHKD